MTKYISYENEFSMEITVKDDEVCVRDSWIETIHVSYGDTKFISYTLIEGEPHVQQHKELSMEWIDMFDFAHLLDYAKKAYNLLGKDGTWVPCCDVVE
jgi:hypothetical protein